MTFRKPESKKRDKALFVRISQPALDLLNQYCEWRGLSKSEAIDSLLKRLRLRPRR